MGSPGSPSGLRLMLCLPSARPQALNISDHYPVEVDLALNWAVHGVQPPCLATLWLSLLLPLLAPQLGLVA